MILVMGWNVYARNLDRYEYITSISYNWADDLRRWGIIIHDMLMEELVRNIDKVLQQIREIYPAKWSNVANDRRPDYFSQDTYFRKTWENPLLNIPPKFLEPEIRDVATYYMLDQLRSNMCDSYFMDLYLELS